MNNIKAQEAATVYAENTVGVDNETSYEGFLAGATFAAPRLGITIEREIVTISDTATFRLTAKLVTQDEVAGSTTIFSLDHIEAAKDPEQYKQSIALSLAADILRNTIGKQMAEAIYNELADHEKLRGLFEGQHIKTGPIWIGLGGPTSDDTGASELPTP